MEHTVDRDTDLLKKAGVTGIVTCDGELTALVDDAGDFIAVDELADPSILPSAYFLIDTLTLDSCESGGEKVFKI